MTKYMSVMKSMKYYKDNEILSANHGIQEMLIFPWSKDELNRIRQIYRKGNTYAEHVG